MKLKETLENNIMVVVVAVAVAVAGTTFAVVNYYNAQKVASIEQSFNFKLAKLESKLASIDRDLPGIEHFDIRGLFLAENETRGIDPGLFYFKDDRFYASKSDPYWKYSKTTELALIKLVTGIDFDDPMLGMLGQAAVKFPIHLWRADESIVMVDKGEKLNLFPHIIVQKVPNSEIGEVLGLGVSFGRWVDEEDDMDFDADDIDLSGDEDVDELLAAMNRAYYNDAAGFFFLMQTLVNFNSAMMAPNQVFKIKKVQKLGNILYCQFVTEFYDVTVREQTTTVYLHQEIMVISERDSLYFIKITLPSLEPQPRAPIFANVNGWLTNVKLVRD